MTDAEADKEKRLIFVAEDDPAILRQIEFILTSRGYRVETAMNGVDALKRLLSLRPDLLITDVMMPEMDGYELVESLRRDPELALLPIIILTAKTQDNEMMTGYQSGADMYLTKPFNPDELLMFVQRLLK